MAGTVRSGFDSSIRLTDFGLEVSRGNIPNIEFARLFGKVSTVQISTPADVWNYGITAGAETYTFSSTADIDTISSDNAGDTMDITIEGLDSNYDEVTQTATLNGQNKVTLGTSLLRVNKSYNSSATDLSGNVYIYPNGAITGGIPNDVATVRSYIAAADQQSLQSIYTVPNGKNMYITAVEASLLNQKNSFADLSVNIREFGGVFLRRLDIELGATGSSDRSFQFHFPAKIPSKSDFVPNVDVSVNDTGLAYILHFVLVQES